MIPHYVGGRWCTPDDEGSVRHDATTGLPAFRVSAAPTDLSAALGHARTAGLPALRAVSRQQRARQLRELARLLGGERSGLAALSGPLGATAADAADDADSALLALRQHAAAVVGGLSDADAPADRVLVCGGATVVAPGSRAVEQPLAVDRPGVALHINGFSLPLTTTLERFARSYVAGMPSIVRPAGRTAQLVVRLVELIVGSGIVPEGALQVVSGPVRLPSGFTAQDLVTFTGTRPNATRLRARLLGLATEPRQEISAEPLNCAVLGAGATVDDPAFRLFVERLTAVLTAHAGQSAAAVRRAYVPAALLAPVAQAVAAALARVPIGSPGAAGVRMGPLVDQEHRQAVQRRVARLSSAAEPVFGTTGRVEVVDADPDAGAFLAPVLLVARPDADPLPLHTVEAFGPVSTLIPYQTPDDIAGGLALGRGGLTSWVVTEDPAEARDVVRALAPWHARLEIIGPETSPAGRTGPGSAECLRRLHREQAAVVVAGSPAVSSAVSGRWVRGAERVFSPAHPMRRHLDEIRIGDALRTGRRVVTRADIDRFTELTGDRFYAHADEAAAARNPVLGGIVAHGSLVIGLATGLFVSGESGPVLANRGLENLEFLAPVRPGDELSVLLTAKEITSRPGAGHGEVRWEVEVANQDGLPVTRYDLLALTAKRPSDAPTTDASITKEDAC